MSTGIAPRVLILGGTGRIGTAVALDLLRYSEAHLILASRQSRLPASLTAVEATGRVERLALNLEQAEALQRAIASVQLVIHCAGPFRHRDLRVLQGCIAARVPYLDVADSSDYVRSALALRKAAAAAGVTAIVSTGVFPGISNSMVRLAAEPFERIDQIQLNYAVAGSGGAGLTVLRTTFLELQHPFEAWLEGRWQTVQPYSQPEPVTFPAPYGTVPVYWFNTSEAATLPKSFAAQTVITKFGSLPQAYNRLTAAMTRAPWRALLNQPWAVERLARVSYAMTQVSDRFSGVGLAMQARVTGILLGDAQIGDAQLVDSPQDPPRPSTHQVTFCHPHTAGAAGVGTGAIATAILTGRLQKPGVWPVEQAISNALFLRALADRQLSQQLHLENLAIG